MMASAKPFDYVPEVATALKDLVDNYQLFELRVMLG
jgi:hypothetical protein